MTDELRYRLLTWLEENPNASQREIARHLGISLGKVNYCLHALIEVGAVKVHNFRRNQNKMAYAYVLTPAGIEEKVAVTYRFLKHKIEEYDTLSFEIARLREELERRAMAQPAGAGE